MDATYSQHIPGGKPGNGATQEANPTHGSNHITQTPDWSVAKSLLGPLEIKLLTWGLSRLSQLPIHDRKHLPTS